MTVHAPGDSGLIGPYLLVRWNNHIEPRRSAGGAHAIADFGFGNRWFMRKKVQCTPVVEFDIALRALVVVINVMSCMDMSN